MKPTTLLDTARSLNSAIEQNYLGLALLLVEIERDELYKDAGYDTFVDFYSQDLKREKSTVSRLLKAGHWLKDNYGAQLPSGQFSYKRLVASINTFPDQKPEYILAAAQTLTNDDFKAHKKDNCEGHDLDMTRRSAPCKNCSCWIKV